MVEQEQKKSEGLKPQAKYLIRKNRKFVEVNIGDDGALKLTNTYHNPNDLDYFGGRVYTVSSRAVPVESSVNSGKFKKLYYVLSKVSNLTHN